MLNNSTTKDGQLIKLDLRLYHHMLCWNWPVCTVYIRWAIYSGFNFRQEWV